MMATDLERAVAALKKKGPRYDRLWRYFDGDQPVVYTAERLAQIFQNVSAKFVENWCAVVVNSALERIQLQEMRVPGSPEAQTVLERLFTANRLNLEADDAHEAALVTGEAFLIVWNEADGTPEVYFNDSRLCHIFYDEERPRVKRFAAKWWQTETQRRLTLYYPDRLEYYAAERKADDPLSTIAATQFVATGEAANPTGQVPVFHLRATRRATSELSDAIPLQDGVNKLLIDMMVSAEYGAFKQRYIISNAENLGQLKNAPNEVWDLPAGDGLGQGTTVGEFGATDLRNYFEAIDRLALAIGVITRTPKHYFFAQSGDPSGEALLAMEAPLNKKCKARIERFTPVWREAAAFLLGLAGVPVDETAIVPVFEPPETVQPLTGAQVRNFDVNSGIPLRTRLRREGWDEAELAQLDADRAAEQAASGAGLAQALLNAQRRFDRGEGA